MLFEVADDISLVLALSSSILIENIEHFIYFYLIDN